MESTIRQPIQAVTYPCLMETLKGIVYLMSNPNEGTVVHPATSDYTIGTRINKLSVYNMRPFKGTVELKG